MRDSIQIYQKTLKEIKALDYALNVISWDSSTVAPKGCFNNRSKYIGILAGNRHKLITNKEYIDAVNYLYKNRKELEENLQYEITRVKRENDMMMKVPSNLYSSYYELLAVSNNVWEEAKLKNDFSLFYETLDNVIKITKKLTKYWSTQSLKGYNVLLDMYEPGFKKAKYDKFFNCLKEKLVPFVKKVLAKPIKVNECFFKNFSIEKQKEFTNYIAEVMKFDLNYGMIAESEHPFTSAFDIEDVRLTTHFYENNLQSSIFSTIHELGHATYERNISPDLADTFSATGASMAMHESQSRFYENIIGRHYNFWKVHYKKLKEIFHKELLHVSLHDFYMYINEVKASYIRTDADELTYPLHIMLRYDIEKEIFDGNLETKDIEKRWNELFYEYFGIEVDKASNGVLQDVHWSGGSFGYFPTYALGSAYAAQIYHSMIEDINLKTSLESGTTEEINLWLKEKIHKYGASKSPNDILLLATGKKFNPNYYVKYLIKKYSKIYGIK